MTIEPLISDPQKPEPSSLKSLVNTPWKKAMLIVQVSSYVLIVASPLIGGAVGRLMDLNGKQTGALILGVFIAGEVLFYVSLAFLGKEIVKLIRDVIRSKFRRKS